MKKNRLLIALAIILLPIISRFLWFYRGIYFPSRTVQEPDYLSLSIPQPEIATPFAVSAGNKNENITILFDQSHTNRFSLPQIDALTSSLLWQGAEIAILENGESLSENLKSAVAFVIIAPTLEYSDEEIRTVTNFVERGGRLLVITDPTRSFYENPSNREDSVDITNSILAPFDLAFHNDYVYNLTKNEGNFRNVYLKPVKGLALTKKIDQVVFYAARSVAAKNNFVILGDDDTLSSLTDQGGNLALAALSSNGNVLALGDVTFINSPYYQVEDNYQFVVNMSDFLMNAERIRTLTDFPELFSQPVGVLLTDGIELDQALITELSDLIDSREESGTTITLLEEPKEGYDLIVLGLFPPEPDMAVFVKEFGIDFDYNSEEEFNGVNSDFNIQENGEVLVETTPVPTQGSANTPSSEGNTPFPSPTPTPYQDVTLGKALYIPGFGKIPAEGLGFFLLDHQIDRTVLILMTDNQEDLVDLLTMLVRGSIKGCLVQHNIAVCEQYAIREFYEEELFEEQYDDFTLTPEEEATPESTPELD
ncbi:MAG TPA: DUF4350 domain-containing protein [Anaerolineae bacterium]|nr:DUF4350 domain-containing protein [Anaerolineae bacterium]